MSDIDGIFAGLDTKLVNFKKEWGMEFMERVKRRTPVITGKLQNGWGFTLKQSDIEIWNIKEYASYVEYGTPKMAPRGMMRVTLLESEQIAAVAAQKSGLK